MTLTEQAQQIITDLDEIASTYMKLVHSRDERVKRMASILAEREMQADKKLKKLEAEIKALKSQGDLF